MSTESEVAALKARLEAAERVCVLYGWSAAPSSSEREKAAEQAWMDWAHTPGVDTSPKGHPELSDEVIAGLARRRDEIRGATIRHFFGDEAETDA